jgi:hypothetical protein
VGVFPLCQDLTALSQFGSGKWSSGTEKSVHRVSNANNAFTDRFEVLINKVIRPFFGELVFLVFKGQNPDTVSWTV